MSKHPRSPLAPKKSTPLKPVRGVRLTTLCTGLRYKGRDDLMLASFDKETSVAGVLTQSLAAAAPVLWCRKILGKNTARALLVNAGNANAATGKLGESVVRQSVESAAAAVGCKKNQVFLASTGIVGQPLPKYGFGPFVPALAKKLPKKTSATVWHKAARAIMTTDTFPKFTSRTAKIGGKKVTISGFCKGSGMIAPNMATLLAFVFTDATLPPRVLQGLLNAGVDKSFNSITVDGDTSTNDTLLVFATGAVKHPPVLFAADPKLRDFTKAFEEVLIELAQLVARDGEGAQKFITIDVTGAASDKAARNIGLTIGNSLLVKTALAAGDANWGRILAAAGYSGERMDQRKAAVSMGGIPICRKGELVRNYNEAPVAKHLKGREVFITVDVGVGKGKARIWTCDLTHGYIDINASYRS
jgi:glutamate N-acetyltransferase/amino-acid N-acetyltransferase